MPSSFTNPWINLKRPNLGPHHMTNRDMVKDPKPGGPKLPEPNVPKREAPVPAPEDDPYLFTTNDPVDSPQANPVINPRPRSRVLGGCGRAET